MSFKNLSFSFIFKILLLLCLSCIQEIEGQEVNSCPETESIQSEPDCLVFTLSGAVSQALNSNRQFLGTVEKLTSAQYGIDLAESEFNISITPTSQAGYVGGDKHTPGWTVGGGVDFSKKFTTGTLISVVPSIVKAHHHYVSEVQTTISQPLLRGLGKEYQLSHLFSAQYGLRQAYRNLYTAQVQLILRTIQNLYDIIKAEKSWELNQESYQRIRQFYQAAKLKEKIGLSDSMDVYRAETELRQAEDALKATQERLEESKDNLRDLLALPLDSCIKVDAPVIYTPHPVDLDKAVEMALKNRIEIDQSQDDLQENKRLSRIAEKNLYPELNLVLNYSNVGRAKHFKKSFQEDRENIWGIGFTTSTDFSPLAEQVAYEQSLMAVDAASRNMDQTEAAMILEVKKAKRQLDRAYERIQLQEEQIKTAQGELYLAKIKFDRGMADNFNVIQAEKSLRSAQQNHWSAIIDHIIGEFQLLVAMGLLIDKPKIR